MINLTVLETSSSTCVLFTIPSEDITKTTTAGLLKGSNDVHVMIREGDSKLFYRERLGEFYCD